MRFGNCDYQFIPFYVLHLQYEGGADFKFDILSYHGLDSDFHFHEYNMAALLQSEAKCILQIPKCSSLFSFCWQLLYPFKHSLQIYGRAYSKPYCKRKTFLLDFYIQGSIFIPHDFYIFSCLYLYCGKLPANCKNTGSFSEKILLAYTCLQRRSYF